MSRHHRPHRGNRHRSRHNSDHRKADGTPTSCCTNPTLLESFFKEIASSGQSFTDTAKAHVESAFPQLGYLAPSHIFYNGTIRTMADGDADQTVEALAIAADTIVAAGTLGECRSAAPGADEVDLGGACMLPGLIEPHVHVLLTSIYDTWVPLSPFDGQDLVGESYKLPWVYATLKAALDKGQTKNGWLMGFGVDPSMFSDMNSSKDWMDPTKQELDANVSDSTPIFLMNSSGHVGYCNTPALQAADFESEHGILTELEMVEVLGVAVKESSGSVGEFLVETLASMRQMFQRAAALGVTTMFDAALGSTGTMEELQLFNLIATLRLCPQRLGGGVIVADDAGYDNWSRIGLTPTTFTGDRFQVPNIKIVSDGSNQGLTGFQSEPYPHPSPIVNVDGHECGIWNLGEGNDYIHTMQRIERDGWTLMVHANGDAAVERIIAGYDKVVSSSTVGQRRHRIEHCSILNDSHIDDMARLGISSSFLIGHVGYWGHTMAENCLGRAKAELLDRTASVAARGMRFTLHSDHYVSPLGPLRMAEQAVTRKMEAISSGDSVLNKGECIDIRRALRAITFDAAWQCNMDAHVGHLALGMKADLVVLETDPVSMPSVEGLRHVKVCQTWMGGKRTHQA